MCTILVALCMGVSAARAQDRGAVEGVAYDSIHMRPLQDATIIASIANSSARQEFRAARSDRNGRFQIDSLLAGTYTISVEHSMLDSLGIHAESRAEIVAGKRTQVFVATPTRSALMRGLCPSAELDSTIGIVLGVARNAEHEPVANARVTLAWNELKIDKRTAQLSQQPLSATVTADERGVYRACGVPTHTLLIVAAQRDNDDQASMSKAEVPSAGLLVLDVVTTRKGSAGATHVLAGRVQQPSGAPLSSARVSVTGTTLSATTDQNGAFRIPAAPSGTSVIDVVAIGFDPHRELLEMPDHDTTLTITIEKGVLVLDSVRVQATARADGLSGFESRRKSGKGYFVTEEEIAAMRAISNEDVLRRIPGIQVVHVRAQTRITPGKLKLPDKVPEGTYILGRGGSSPAEQPCSYDVYIDGARGSGTDLERIPPQAIHAIEVHSPSTLPLRYSSTCGALFVWTKQ